jgi:ABC-type nickel/cobalt efflux system permease component RcnA
MYQGTYAKEKAQKKANKRKMQSKITVNVALFTGVIVVFTGILADIINNL